MNHKLPESARLSVRAPSPATPDEWICEDELPEGYPYHEMFPHSKLGQDGRGGVRIFPKVAPSPATTNSKIKENTMDTTGQDFINASGHLRDAVNKNPRSAEEVVEAAKLFLAVYDAYQREGEQRAAE